MPRSKQELKYFIEQFSSSSTAGEAFLEELKEALDANDERALHDAVLAVEARDSLNPLLFSALQRYLDDYDYEQNQAKPISFDQFPWESAEEKATEWAYAKQKLMPDGVLLADGTKLRRKDPENAECIKHSFIIVDGKILAMAPQGDYLGRGGSAIVKLAEDDHGGVWALKIRRNPRDIYSGGGAYRDSPEMEETVAVDLGKSLKSVSRSVNGASFFSEKREKHYLPFIYLGMPLYKFLEYDLSEAQRYELGIQLALAVNDYQSGEHSKTNTKYIHRDLTDRNVVIDDEGTVHLIDYGCSKVKDNSDSRGYYYFRDVEYLLQLLAGPQNCLNERSSGRIFTKEMCSGNEELKNLLKTYSSKRGFPENYALEIAQKLMHIASNAAPESQSPKL